MLLASLVIIGASSCSRIERLAEGRPDSNQSEAFKVPPFLQGGGRTGESQVRVSLENPSDLTGDDAKRVQERERDLMWTDPDNPEESMEGLEEVMAEGSRQGPWYLSYSEARRIAMRSGKPMLVWFTDTRFSPLCRSLDGEVFSVASFGEWASGELVRLRLDFNVTGAGDGQGRSAMDDKIRKENYLQSLKKRYKVLGFPTVMIITPDGRVVARYRGYKKSYFDFYLARLKNDTRKAVELHGEWREGMARRGYREWTDGRGRKLFAKLSRYREGELILVEPDGKRILARESKLSAEDRTWILRQKARAGN